MNGEKAFSQAPATPEQILAVFQDWQRLEWGTAFDTKQTLSFDTTVKAWRNDCELQGWQRLGEALNKFFGTNFQNHDWSTPMKPEKQRTVRDVCSLIATRAFLPTFGELSIFGKRCRSASAFFALRSSLQVRGVDATGLRPSTKLNELLRLNDQTLIETVIKLVPGRLPQMKTRLNLGHRLSAWACLAGVLVLIGGGISEMPQWTVAGCLILALGFIAVTVFSNLPPAKVQLDSLETFGDLSRFIAQNTAT